MTFRGQRPHDLARNRNQNYSDSGLILREEEDVRSVGAPLRSARSEAKAPKKQKAREEAWRKEEGGAGGEQASGD